jgi:hypothetical protein
MVAIRAQAATRKLPGFISGCPSTRRPNSNQTTTTKPTSIFKQHNNQSVVGIVLIRSKDTSRDPIAQSPVSTQPMHLGQTLESSRLARMRAEKNLSVGSEGAHYHAHNQAQNLDTPSIQPALERLQSLIIFALPNQTKTDRTDSLLTGATASCCSSVVRPKQSP